MLLHKLLDDMFYKSAYCGPYECQDVYPLVNVSEENDVLTLSIPIPGMKQDQLDISLENDLLTITGEKKQKYENKNYLKKERKFGSFKRDIKLPYPVNSEKVEARLEYGILHIVLHRSEEAKPKKIAIN